MGATLEIPGSCRYCRTRFYLAPVPRPRGETAMEQPQYDLDWLISVDDHVIEPPDLWQSRLPKQYLDVGPRMVHDEKGSRWLYEDTVTPTSGLSVTRGKRKEEFSPAPVPFEEMHPS